MDSVTYSTVAPSQPSGLLITNTDGSPTTSVMVMTAKTGGSSQRSASRTSIIVSVVVGLAAVLLLLLLPVLCIWLWRRYRYRANSNRRQEDENVNDDPDSEKVQLQEATGMHESSEDAYGYGGESDKARARPRRWFSRVREFWSGDGPGVGPYSRLQAVGSAFVVVADICTMSPWRLEVVWQDPILYWKN
ncbi:hypothetical protein GSI_08481 [Ganoderma sinense ZZ0214-1]|uniref:Uncharacterized protein n=1 Tax=Ganoderma sinense ZZ0214-1 TaxID=1077348 RepID=A0A2G8S3Z0_9APHY|nr:hypothetical protein GSI_08481 [Ganoderma sinense ZZ0214-1]